jgi:PAS domain-containing protein
MRNIATKLLMSIGIATIFFSIFLLYQTYSLTNRRVKDLVEQQASMALKFDLAIRKYVDQKIRPLMYELVGEDEFIPETMSTSYVARSIFDIVRDEFPGFILKFSSDNPRNPANQAGSEELRVIEYLNNNPGINSWEGEISIDGKKYMAKFSARRMKESCLRCHGDPKDAPASLLKRYGSTAGFHQPIGKIIGSDTIAIPIKKISEQLWSESIPTFLVSGLSLIFFFLAIFLTIRFLITNRLTMISKHFVNASEQEGYSNINPIEIKGKDEIFDLAFSFNTLSAKLKDFYSSLDRQVKERTMELANKNEQLQFEIEERRQAEEEVKLNEQRLEALLELNQMTEATLEEITAFALEEAVRLTQSKIGYVAFVSEDESILTMHAWSRQALRECRTTEKPIIYPVVNTGLWGEAVRQRRPVITNDYQALNPLKKGMPEGHVNVTRHMNVPIFDGDRIVVVAGVGNKEADYDDSDVRQLALLMSGMWRIVQRKHIEETLRESEGKYRTVLEVNPDPVVVYDMEGNVIYFNPAFTRVFGWTLEERLGKKWIFLFLKRSCMKPKKW